MSGGVDSSVAAARLVAAGHEVVGVTLHLWDTPDDGSVRGRCCAPEDQHDARRVADALGIDHYAFDRRSDFAREVVDPFVDAYLQGETPSPCVACNRGVKLRELFALADRLGAARVATGHYARVAHGPDGARLLRAVDLTKDQSYFLHALPPALLARLWLPLGDAHKHEVRAEARARSLAGADKGDSQELCFVPSGRYDAFVEARADGRLRPGPILDERGQQVGTHGGVHRFTVGQRKGLGVALGERAFVVGLDAATGSVQLGPPAALDVASVEVDDWVEAPGTPPRLEATVKVRARHDGAAARVEAAADGRRRIRFASPVRGVARGQYAVAYQGDMVVGGGRIVATHGVAAAASEVHA
ncbi:MAG: tRNA 2-thiouridine(34) synthase MnmA [Myxococcales bacterium]|nr:MAG: tRNA 2-thiouridine(34) synthase MnmA [Myxococcales bacterium]